MKTPDPHLFCFGLGFSGQALARLALAHGWQISGTVRSEAKAARLREQGINALVLDTDAADRLPEDVIDAIRRSTHLLQSVGTARSGDDPVLPLLAQAAEAMADGLGARLVRLPLHHRGLWRLAGGLGERGQRDPQHPRPGGWQRLRAEAAWAELSTARGLGLHVFRLAGIYGPGRNALETVLAGKARIIDKPDQVFSRIHVEDIATAVRIHDRADSQRGSGRSVQRL